MCSTHSVFEDFRAAGFSSRNSSATPSGIMPEKHKPVQMLLNELAGKHGRELFLSLSKGFLVRAKV